MRLVLPLAGVALPLVVAGLALAGAARGGPAVEEAPTAAPAVGTPTRRTISRPAGPDFVVASDLLDALNAVAAYPRVAEAGPRTPDVDSRVADDFLAQGLTTQDDFDVVVPAYLELLRAAGWRIHPGSPRNHAIAAPKMGVTSVPPDWAGIDASNGTFAAEVWIERRITRSGAPITTIDISVRRCTPADLCTPTP